MKVDASSGMDSPSGTKAGHDPLLDADTENAGGESAIWRNESLSIEQSVERLFEDQRTERCIATRLVKQPCLLALI